jgi:transcriptional regulator with XRE-family HTH domain
MAANRRLRQARELRGWSQAKLAELLGTDATTVSRWERGLFSPTPYFRERLCDLFGKNTEELGFLEEHHSQAGPLPLPASSSFQTRQALTEPLQDEDASQLISWPRREDTFTYILSSATHDRYAHMLWEDAYVRSLQGKPETALQLAEASKTAFEQIGHPNAHAIEEWLQQRGLATDQADDEATPIRPIRPPRHRRSGKQLVARVSMGVFSVFLLLGLLGFAGQALGLFSFVQAGRYPFMLVASGGQQQQPQPVLSSKHYPTTPVTSANQPASSPTVLPDTTDIRVQVSPGKLTPQDCVLEPIGYRCTIRFSLFSASEKSFTWQVGSSDLAVQFHPAAGSGEPGQSLQIIAYVSASSPSGQLTLTFICATKTTSASVIWQG